MIRWSMRPTGDPAKFSVATDVEDDRVHFVVNALDKDDEFLNFLEMTGTANNGKATHEMLALVAELTESVQPYVVGLGHELPEDSLFPEDKPEATEPPDASAPLIVANETDLADGERPLSKGRL